MLYKFSFLLFLCCSFMLPSVFAQPVTLEAYTFESGNRGFLNQVYVSAQDPQTGEVVAESFSDMDGFMTMELPENKVLNLYAVKDLFHTTTLEINTAEWEGDRKLFVKLEMRRAPGYLFEITLAEARDSEDIPVSAIKGALIEVYNNTTKKEILRLEDHADPEFKITLLKGNHYTILIRKKGFLAKRMEAFVNVEGCILCFEGVGKVEPGVSENLTEGHDIGTLLANVEMEPLFKGKKIELQNIYYDYNKADIRPDAKEELDKVVLFMRDNPHLTVELGSHTDARGKKAFNMNLSRERARTAVNYLTYKGNISKKRIVSKGYGESQLANHCADDVECAEEEHAINRRTELKILGIEEDNIRKSLVELKQEEELEKLIEELQNQEVIRIEEGEELPDEMKTIEMEESSEKKDHLEEVLQKQGFEKIEELEEVIEQELSAEESKEEVEEVREIFKDEKVEKVEIPTGESDVKLFGDYTGFKIAAVISQDKLTPAHKIFKQFDTVKLYSEEGQNYYLIGNFTKRMEAMQYLNKVIRLEYPRARLLGFLNGERTE